MSTAPHGSSSALPQRAHGLRDRQGAATGCAAVRAVVAVAVLVIAVTALLEPSAARAGTVSKDGSVVRWTGDSAADFVQAGIYPTNVRIVEQGGIGAGVGCTKPVSDDEATCELDGVTGLILDASDGADSVLCFSSSGDSTMRCVVNGGSGDDSLRAERWATVTLNGGADNDTLVGSVLDETLDGGSGDDTLSGDWGADTLSGGPGDDTMMPGDGAMSFDFDGGDVVSGGFGTDTLSYFAQAGDRSISFDGVANDGKPGEDDNVLTDVENFRGGNGTETVVGGDGPNDFGGGPGADVLDGAAGADILRSSGDDTLRGGEGDDLFVQVVPDLPGFPGSVFFAARETLAGGPGDDTADYGGRGRAVAIDTDGIADDGAVAPITIGADIVFENDNVLADVEHVVGGVADDHLSATRMSGGAGADLLRDRPGGQRFSGGPGEDEASYQQRAVAVEADADGATGDDGAAGEGDTIDTDVENLTGGSGPDRLGAGPTSSLLAAGPGDDVLVGGPGEDLLDGGAGDDVMRGGVGTDTATYEDRTDDIDVRLDGKALDGAADEFDNVGPEDDVENVVAGVGADVLVGNAQANELDGGAGDDLLRGGTGPDALLGSGDDDTADWSDRTEPLTVDLGQTGTVAGGRGDDGPGLGRDRLSSIENAVTGSGADTLIGDDTDNFLDGGLGSDTITGRNGFDIVFYDQRAEGVSVELGAGAVSGSPLDGTPGARDALGVDVEGAVGGTGPDRLTGNTADNFLAGSEGDDVVDLRGVGDDEASCGAGTDGYYADPEDSLDSDCELSLMPAATPTTGIQSVPTTPTLPRDSAPRAQASAAIIGRPTLSSFRRRGLQVELRCPTRCRSRVRLVVSRTTARRLGLARGDRVVGTYQTRRAATGNRVVTVHPRRRAAAGLRTVRTLTVEVMVTLTFQGDHRKTMRITRRLR